MDKNPMTIDRKWNKWLIIGGLALPYPLVALTIFFQQLINPSMIGGSIISVLVVLLGIWAFWLGILNYTKLHPGLKMLLALVLTLASLFALFLIAMASSNFGGVFS